MRDDREFRLHCVIADYLRFAADPATLWLAIPNGEKRELATGARLKRMGVYPGAADLHLTIAGRSHWLELKADGGKLSPAQELFQEHCARAGAPYAVARSLDEAQKILGEWGALRRSERHDGRLRVSKPHFVPRCDAREQERIKA
jgi:hypothetical protein